MPLLTLCTNFLYGLQIDEQPALSLLSLPPAEWSSRLFFSSPQAPISGCRGFGRSLGSPTPQISTVCTSKSTNSHPRNFRLVQLAVPLLPLLPLLLFLRAIPPQPPLRAMQSSVRISAPALRAICKPTQQRYFSVSARSRAQWGFIGLGQMGIPDAHASQSELH